MKAILIGVGGMGRAWTRALMESTAQGWQIAALADVNREALLQTVAEWPQLDSVPQFTDAEEALRQVEADVAVIVTPPAFHKTQTLAALAAGKHVLTEKPQAENMADAQMMVAAAQAAGKTLMVAQNYRYSAAARTVKQALERGDIGPVGYVSVQFQKAPRFGGFREQMQYPLLVDMAIHHFDLMRYFTGGDPESVWAHSFRPEWSWFEHDPSLAMVVTMAGGAVVDYFGSWVGVGAETGWSGDWRIQGPDGCILWTEHGITLATSATSEPKDIPIIQMPRQAQHALLDEMATAISEGRPPLTSGADNLKSLAMVFAGVESAQNSRQVRITL